jgi:chemotaxis protein methyltransferase CheR
MKRGQTPDSKIRPESYRFLREHVYSRAGIVLEDDQPSLLESRLLPIITNSIDDLCAVLLAALEPGLILPVVEAMTTNETYFFRYPAHYEAIRSVLLLRRKQDQRCLERLRF